LPINSKKIYYNLLSNLKTKKMKTIVPQKSKINVFLLIISALFSGFAVEAQTSTINLDFSANPVLISGTARQVGAKYIYQNVAPTTDAIVTIDSLVNGATLNTIDDNTGKNGGYVEGFQPQITSGSNRGYSYVVFTIDFKLSGTSITQKLDSLSLTALDIDGTSTLKEFDQISLGSGATAWYKGSNPTISLTSVSSGTFSAINVDGKTQNGVDTSARSNMFTITNTNVSSFTVKMGMYNSHSTKTLRLFSIYTKGFAYPDMAVMPITLESFTTALNNKNTEVNVNWITATESNVSHFQVQRSIDGKNFTEAGIVFSDGNSTKPVNYNFTDNIGSVQANTVYYRLCTVDLDGRKQYSDIRMVRIFNGATQNLAVRTYPNPAVNELRVTIPSVWQEKSVSYVLYNSFGQISKRIDAGNSTQTTSIDVSSLSKGMYVLQVMCEGQSSQQKIIKF
jgi:hypothetical protein